MLRNPARLAAVAPALLISCQLLLDIPDVPDAGSGSADAGASDAASDALVVADAPCVRAPRPSCTGLCPPTVLADGLTTAIAIVAEPSPCGTGHVLWASTGCQPDAGPPEITIARKDGSEKRQFATATHCIVDLVGGRDYVAWAAVSEARAALWDGGNDHLVTSAGDVYNLAVAGDFLYWGSTQTPTLGRNLLTAAACDNCKYADPVDRVLAIGGYDGTVIYSTLTVGSAGDGGAVWQLRDDRSSQLLADNLNFPSPVIVPSNDRVFFPTPNGIRSVNLATGVGATVVAENASRLAVHGNTLFWTVGNEVHQSDLNGGALKVLARDQAVPTALAVDDDAVYWINTGSGQVMKLARD